MDTRRYILKEHVQDFPDVIDIPPVEEEIRDALRKYVTFGEELQCLEQLFEVFAYNLEQLDSYCTMYYDDRIIRNRDRKPSTFIEINAHFINVISSGRTLMEATEKILGILVGEDRKKALWCERLIQDILCRSCIHKQEQAQSLFTDRSDPALDLIGPEQPDLFLFHLIPPRV